MRFTVQQLMIAVAFVAILLPAAGYLYRINRNLDSYFRWASDTRPNRASTYHVPYPADGNWDMGTILGYIGFVLCIAAGWYLLSLRNRARAQSAYKPKRDTGGV
jgi:hypothetical protein